MKIPKKLVVDDDVYIMVRDKQNELIRESGMYINLYDITNIAIKTSINNVHIEDVIKEISKEVN